MYHIIQINNDRVRSPLQLFNFSILDVNRKTVMIRLLIKIKDMHITQDIIIMSEILAYL